jgi:murein DD-endopeptidase MepM/ murein hydrolase activator NlpD
MGFEIDPAFRNSGTRARARRERRMLLRLGVFVLAVLALAGLLAGLMQRESPQTAAVEDTAAGDETEGFDDFVLVQTDMPAGAEVPLPRDPRASFLNLRRDPMILRLDQADAVAITKIPGPPGFVPTRAGPDGAERIAVLRDQLFSGERRLMTTLPSSRDDFALFQAQRSQAIAQLQNAAPANLMPVGAGQEVRVTDSGSWGELIASNAADPDDTGAAVYVETQIENTTSMAFALRESQRFPLFQDVIVILQTDRALVDVLQTNGFATPEAEAVASAAVRLLAVPEVLPTGSIVALRLRPDVEGKSLMQMSLYAPDGYLATLAQTGARRFAPAADPWLQDNLLGRSDRLRAAAPPPRQIRLLDALYSAAIRNGLPTSLVGELIVIMSQRFDLERFVADGDALTVLYAENPGPQGQGLGRLLFVGIDGPSGAMPCYVVQADTAAGFGCFNFDATAPGGAGSAAGRLGGGLLIPVDGVRTSGFGPRLHPILNQVRHHNGVDWAAPTGTPVRAVADGVLALIGDASGYGNVIYVDHPGGMQTRYAHLNAFAEGLAKGSPVQAGQTIGYVGTTGRSTGPHLHFELHVAGRPVDPMAFAGTDGPAAGGASGAVDALVNQIIEVESAGDARARNPLSTATGLGQFIESTWLRMMRDYRPDLAGRMTRAQLLYLRFDATLSREMVANLARENEGFLRARGHDITAGRLYLAHFLGPAGAHSALSASPEATVLQVMGAAVVNANPFLRDKTMADLRDWADRKMAGQGRALVSTPRPVPVPPEVAAYRATVDAILAAL